MTNRVRIGLAGIAAMAWALAGCATDDAGSAKKGSCCSDSSSATCCDSGAKTGAKATDTKADAKPQAK